MDILRFVNSKDIKRHLKEADYKFTPLEAAWLVYQCQEATVPEKHMAWKEIIDTMPDCKIEARRNTLPQESLHGFLKEYMEIENRLIEEFCDEHHNDTFSDDKPYVYKFEYIYQDGSKYDWGTVFSCYDALLENIMEPEENVAFILCIKMRIDRLSMCPQSMLISPKLEIMSIDAGLTDDAEINDIYYGVFGGLWFDFPTPFRKGDIVWKPGRLHGLHNGPFVTEGINLDRIEKEEVKERIRANGDDTDMFAEGYFVNEDGTIIRECMDNYMNLEYFDKELSPAEKALGIISDLLKGKTEKDSLERFCLSMASGRVKESLRLAGLLPSSEQETMNRSKGRS